MLAIAGNYHNRLTPCQISRSTGLCVWGDKSVRGAFVMEGKPIAGMNSDREQVCLSLQSVVVAVAYQWRCSWCTACLAW
jgi:hypothetical protein